ncbi:hypothetical protein [Paenibacillus sinopodophylli]|uniref:hypothetical protein n=1 Tax=Paenibacillus sinopodophylli TaxID=1837342 RepID=UPI00110D07C3|nr:hypothetical protein [Paenibacillus sinopodophylli]
MNKTYIFFGISSEYVLNPLYRYMKDKGYSCVEITNNTSKNIREDMLRFKNDNVVLITSAHVFLDYDYYKRVYDYSINGLTTVLEAIDILKPVKTVHYPHDLATLMHNNDLPWLKSIFELILFPLDGYAHLSCEGRDVYNVGWIKKVKNIGDGNKNIVYHGLSDFGYYKDVNFALKTFSPVWNEGAIVKLPDIGDYMEYVSNLKASHVNLTNSERNIFELIDHGEIMITNGLTSVNIESSLSGRFTINMLDGCFAESEHRRHFEGLPNLKMLSISDTALLLKDYRKGNFVPKKGENLLKSFDFEMATKLITK